MRIKRKEVKNKWLFHHIAAGQVFEVIGKDEVLMKIEPTNVDAENDSSFDNAVNLFDGSLMYVGTHAEVVFHGNASVSI